MSSGKLQGFKQDEDFSTTLIKCTTKIYPDLPSFSAGVTSAKVGAEEQVGICHPSGTATKAWEKLGKGNQGAPALLQCHLKLSETERTSD